ncbi:Chitin-domain 3 [Cordyceps militaris]|uniref:Chitin-domain 3 n=1 Tax=Cordyceps militaris TaxID=73501 RepID=A0A2H4SCC6_CORMI|nr:Chitin-domain 3 [Cordyceps militaris]
MLAKSIAMSALVVMTHGHIIMTNPVPFSKAKLSQAPLDDNGSNFPCKNGGGFDAYELQGASNVYAQGSKQTMKFKGTAVHGGGSCQVSVTTDLKPTKTSVWKVIKSFEGGCPAKDQVGNMPVAPSAEYPIPEGYDFTIPKELSAGNYTLAWTWFNRVGNREMYMNCAPLTVTGSAGSPDFMSGLPDMFVANINTCKLKEGSDLEFPNPGTDVEKHPLKVGSADQQKPIKPACPDVPGGGAPKAAPSGGSAPAPSTAMPAQPTASAPGAGSSIDTPGGFATSVGSQPAPTPAPTPAAPAGSSAGAGSQAPAPAAPSAGSQAPAPAAPSAGSQAPAPATPSAGPSPGGGGGHPPNTACTVDGQWNCIGGTSFQRCAAGMWSAVQPMAAGVCCQPGESSDFKMSAAPPAAKRALRRAARADA